MDKYRFLRSVAIWLGCLAFIAIAFIPLMAAIETALSCGPGLDACTGLGLIIIMMVRPLLIVVFGAILVFTIHRRLRYLQYSAGWSIAAIFWMLASVPYLAFSGFAGPNIGSYIPIFLLVSWIVFLFYAAESVNNTSSDRFQPAWLVAAISAGYVTIFIGPVFVLMGLGTFPPAGNLIATRLGSIHYAIGMIDRLLSFGLPYTLVAWFTSVLFAAALLYILALQISERR